MSVPMDCAGRERQGWLASGGLTAATESVNFDMRLFYEKWFDDIADSQGKSVEATYKALQRVRKTLMHCIQGKMQVGDVIA